ncbi:NIPSNAP family protein [Daeguia caeni]|uniref:NIPSNAP family protein n=1 Tax=Daeguia caeni TaxID=439612 RepID=A0ABV9H7D0_9HYPH
MIVEWTTYRVKPGAGNDVLNTLERLKPQSGIFGVWSSVLGNDHRIYLLTEAAGQSLESRREDLLAGEGLFAPAPFCEDISTSVFRTLDALPGITEGEHGAIYEIRSYELQPSDALKLAEKGWADVLDVRLSIRPITAVMHSVNGLTPRLVHIYPYKDLAERIAVRNQAIATGKWPPKGGAGRNRVMASELAVPAPFSTIR